MAHNQPNNEEANPAPLNAVPFRRDNPNPNEGNGPQQPAAPARRSRIPRGHFGVTSTGPIANAPAILELATSYDLSTVQREDTNIFVPDVQVMFHALSVCDQLMVANNQFLQSCPPWIPIVSQLYLSVLWNYHTMRVFVNSGHGIVHNVSYQNMTDALHLQDCVIPGPLVPFFQSIAAINGPFDWSGDVTPALPTFNEFWDHTHQSVSYNFARQIPHPALLLDQLSAFADSQPPENSTSTYDSFLWFDNIFNQPITEASVNHFLGPHSCCSYHVSQQQHNKAHHYWSIRLNDFIRTDFTAGHPPFTNINQFFGFTTQYGHAQISWFMQISLIMQVYCQYFTGSVPLRAILPTGIGAVAVRGQPRPSAVVRSWLYPRNRDIHSFSSAYESALRPIPETLAVTFRHSDHEIEEQAEQYAISTHTNINWSTVNNTRTNFPTILENQTHSGRYWSRMPHRIHDDVQVIDQYGPIITAYYRSQP